MHDSMILYLFSTANTFTWSGLWMTCYLVISRKLRRVERSSRRLICLWHWLQKKSSASSLRKLWKQSGRGAGALERGNREEEEEKWWVTDKKGCTEVGQEHLWGMQEVLVKSKGEFERVKWEGDVKQAAVWLWFAFWVVLRRQNILWERMCSSLSSADEIFFPLLPKHSCLSTLASLPTSSENLQNGYN